INVDWLTAYCVRDFLREGLRRVGHGPKATIYEVIRRDAERLCHLAAELLGHVNPVVLLALVLPDSHFDVLVLKIALSDVGSTWCTQLTGCLRNRLVSRASKTRLVQSGLDFCTRRKVRCRVL